MYCHCSYEKFANTEDMETGLWMFLQDNEYCTFLVGSLQAIVIHTKEFNGPLSKGVAMKPTDVLPLNEVASNIVFGDWNYEEKRGIFRFTYEGDECHSIISPLTFDEYVSIMSGKPIPEDTFIPARRTKNENRNASD